jgi:hypothetical protein
LYGTFIDLVTDYDGDARDATAPDIGADEFSPGLLPVELTVFNVVLENDDAHLTWTTASEWNSDYYSVERSEDGLSFNTIASLNASGYSTQPSNYFFFDNHVTELGSGKIYYRLLMVDTDGSFEYSPVRWISLSGLPEPILVFPNPFSTELSIKLYADESRNALIIVSDVLGKSSRKIPYDLLEGENFILMNDWKDFMPGIYTLKIINGADVQTLRVVKE